MMKACSKLQLLSGTRSLMMAERVEDEPRAGRPSTSRTDDNVECVRVVLNSDRHLSVRMVAD